MRAMLLADGLLSIYAATLFYAPFCRQSTERAAPALDTLPASAERDMTTPVYAGCWRDSQDAAYTRAMPRCQRGLVIGTLSFDAWRSGGTAVDERELCAGACVR